MPLDHATEFALSFTADAVHLLRRDPEAAGRPWQSLGSADFASASFRADLAALRARAADPDLQGQDLPVVLLIPQDQILYTSLSVPLGPERDAAVGQALDGLTPYEIEELAFDWTDEGADVRVAAVARQTLVEARDFAERHGFASFGYSALPEAEDYPGMPVFGLPEDADDEMPDAISLDLDADLPDAFADEAGFRTRDDHDDPAPDAEAEDITDVSFTELTADAETTVPEVSDAGEDMDIDRAQPVLSGLELPEQAAVEAPQVEDEVTGDPTDPEADQAELFAETDGADTADDAGQDDSGVTQDPPHEVIPDSAPLIAAKDEPVDSEVAADSVRAPQSDAGGGDGANDGVQEPVLATADLDAAAVDKVSVGETTDTAALHGETSDAIAGAAEVAGMNSGDAALRDAPDRDDDELTEAERAALAAAAAELAATEIAAGAARARLRAERSQRVGASGAPTVVRHAPPRDTGAKGRASGVKPAAATAPRAAADVTESASAATRQIAKRGGLVELIAMLGALIIGLLLVWAFIVPRDNLPDMPQVAENAAPVEAERPQASNADPAPAQEQAVAAASSDAQAANDSMAQSEPGQNSPQALPAAAPETGTASQGVATSDIGQPAGRDIAADQPVAGAEVSAQATTDTSPEPAATLPPSAPVMSAEEQALAIALATSAADMIARPPAPRPQPEATQPAATTAATTPNATPAARAEAPRLSSSARPVSAPRRQATAPAADAPPAVPDNPLPLETVQRQTPRPSAVRPPRPTARTAAPAPASVTTPPQQQQVAPRPSTPSVSSLRSSSRPPSRPEGATPELQHERLTPAEQSHLDQFLRDLQQADRRGRDLAAIPGGETYRLAENRPQRRPASGGTASAAAVENAVRSAVDSDPPSSRPGSASTVPARDSGGLLRSSNRPRGKPAGRSAAAPSLSDSAVTQAIAEAVDASTATPGAVALSALTSSNLPPRRSGAGRTAADPATSGAADAPAAAAAPEASGPSDAQQAERRRLDEQLQSQAEARIRARAQADAAAEAQARAQAEARARAQVAAEERAAAARRQTYKPQELDDEPEVAQAVQSGGVTAASVAAAATQRRGIDLGRTTIIGIVGAGQASRALIRLRNGRIVTVRLGDRIDGGTINSIGGGKITYVKAGRQHELRLLDGR